MSESKKLFVAAIWGWTFFAFSIFFNLIQQNTIDKYALVVEHTLVVLEKLENELQECKIGE